jgi:hypothetical protein
LLLVVAAAVVEMLLMVGVALGALGLVPAFL